MCDFFFNDTATTEIYTLSLHDALPISAGSSRPWTSGPVETRERSSSQSAWRPPPRAVLLGDDQRLVGLLASPWRARSSGARDRKSTRLNSSHANISYAVFCLKKKNIHS